MRLRMNFVSRAVVAVGIATSLSFASAPPMWAQTAAPPGSGDTFKDTSFIKPPAGARVAVYEFQDLECPACAHAFPIVHAAVAQYHIPLIERDFPLRQHIWSYDAAIWARYLQDKVSPKVADEYRGAVFAAQMGINSKDDMLQFTRSFFQKHGVQMPFVPDPTGKLAAEVNADRALGEKMGLQHTPTVFVCTDHNWVQVTDMSMLDQTISEMEAHAGPATPTRTSATRRKSSR